MIKWYVRHPHHLIFCHDVRLRISFYLLWGWEAVEYDEISPFCVYAICPMQFVKWIFRQRHTYIFILSTMSHVRDNFSFLLHILFTSANIYSISIVSSHVTLDNILWINLDKYYLNHCGNIFTLFWLKWSLTHP